MVEDFISSPLLHKFISFVEHIRIDKIYDYCLKFLIKWLSAAYRNLKAAVVSLVVKCHLSLLAYPVGTTVLHTEQKLSMTQ